MHEPIRSRETHWRRLIRAAPFVAPWAMGFVLLTLGPFLASLYWSFCRYDLLTPPRWVGSANYARLAEELWTGGPFGRGVVCGSMAACWAR